MIIGFPYQDRKQVMLEFGRLMQLRPAMTQILIYFAFPGTPFHAQVLAEDRYLPQYQSAPDLRRWDGFSMHFKHPNFTATELEGLQRELYRREFHTLGPSMMRLVGAWFQGYVTLRDSSSPLLRARAERLLNGVREALPTLIPAMLLGPTRETRAFARDLYKQISHEAKPSCPALWLQGGGLLGLACWTWLTRILNLFQQPALLRIEHRTPAAPISAPRVSRLQGGFHANLFAVVKEDLVNKVKTCFRRVFPKKDQFAASTITRATNSELVQIVVQRSPASI